MKVRHLALIATGLSLLAGCAGGTSSSTASSTSASSTTRSTGATDAAAPPPPGAGAVVRFSSGEVAVDVTLGPDTPATRDFLSMLPVTVQLSDHAGAEKIAELPRILDIQDSPGSDPQDGDLIYYVPWGNLGFYYDASGVGFSEQTLHLGTYRASRDQLEALSGGPVTVHVLR